MTQTIQERAIYLLQNGFSVRVYVFNNPLFGHEIHYHKRYPGRALMRVEDELTA